LTETEQHRDMEFVWQIIYCCQTACAEYVTSFVAYIGG